MVIVSECPKSVFEVIELLAEQQSISAQQLPLLNSDKGFERKSK